MCPLPWVLRALGTYVRGFPIGTAGKESTCNASDVGDIVQSLSQEDPRRRKWKPTPVFLPGKSRDRGAWRATIHEVTKRVRHNLATKQQQHIWTISLTFIILPKLFEIQSPILRIWPLKYKHYILLIYISAVPRQEYTILKLSSISK